MHFCLVNFNAASSVINQPDNAKAFLFATGFCSEKVNVEATGHDSTQVIQPVHSTVRT